MRLAELAWKTLYIRKEPNSFSEVTEKENEAAFAARPASMRSRKFSRIKMGWDNAPAFTGQTTGMAGDVNQSIGRWGQFAMNGPAISDDKAHGGNLSLKLICGGGVLSGTVAPGITDNTPYQLRLWVWREPQGSMVVALRGFHAGSYIDEVSTYIQDGGNLMVRDLSADRWVDSGLDVPAERWVQLVVNVNRITKMATVSLDVDGQVEHGQATISFHPQSNLKMVAFSAQGAEGTVTYVDDIELIELP